MSPLLRFFWSRLRDAKTSKYALLVLTPIMVKPLDFDVSGKGQGPLHVRLKGLWSLPLIAGGVWAWLIGSVVEWAYGKKLDPTIPFADAMRHLNQTKMIGEPCVLAMVAVALYGISLLRWGYHSGMIHVLKKRWPDLTKPRLLYFIVNTSGMGLWAAIFGAGLFYTIRKWDASGQPAFVPDNHNFVQPVALLLVLILLGGLQHFATQNSIKGMKALYGGHNALRFCVEFCGLVCMTILAYAWVRLV